MDTPKVSFIQISIVTFGIATCFAGFYTGSNGFQNIHLFYCIVLATLLSLLTIIAYSDQYEIKIKEENRETILKRTHHGVITYQISFMMQLLLCCYFSAWGRVFLLTLCMFCSALFHIRMNKFRDDLNSEKENVKAAQEIFNPNLN